VILPVVLSRLLAGACVSPWLARRLGREAAYVLAALFVVAAAVLVPSAIEVVRGYGPEFSAPEGS